MHDFLKDMRLGFRALRRRPLLLITASLTLGLGVGASTAVFSVVEAALVRPLPFEDADRLAVVWGVAGEEQDIRGASPIEIEDWDAAVSAMGPLALYNETTRNLTDGEGAEQLQAETVGEGFFSIIGATPALGRSFLPEDHLPGAAGSAIISHTLWQRRFGGERDVLGRRVVLDDVPFTVVGVMRPGFAGLSFDTELWTPMGPFASQARLEDRGTRFLAAVGRLAPGVTAEVAQEQLDAVAARLADTYPDDNAGRGALLFPLRDFYVGNARSLMLMVLGGVTLLLLIACANVANLQLVRAVDRRREVALRYALGAGAGRVARQVVAESLVLSALGGVAGLMVAAMALQALLPMIPAGVLPPYAVPALSWPVLLFGLATAVAAGLLFAIAPVARASAERPAAVLRGGGRGVGGGAARGQRAIIVAEVALALLLLVTAGMAVGSLRAQLALEPGFDPEGVLASRMSFGSEFDAAARMAFVDELTAELGALAGVDGAAVVSAAPLRGYQSASYIYRAEDPRDAEHRIRFYFHGVTPGAFDVMGVPIVAGRGLMPGDRADAPAAAVVSEAFAAKVWPGEEPLGRRVYFAGDTATVVGVAGNVRQRTLTVSLMDPGEDPDVYFSYEQLPFSNVDIVTRAAGPDAATLAATLAGDVRRTVARLDPSIALYDVAPLQSEIDAQTALGRMVSAFLAAFAILALVAAAIGLFGVLAFTVRGRRSEIAIRSALGADARRITGLVVRQAVGMVLAGLVLGTLATLALGQVIASQLYGVDPMEPLILVGTALALLAVSLAASAIPAAQALRVDPRSAMAEE